MSEPTLLNITEYLNAKCKECKFIAGCHYIDILIQQYEKANDSEKENIIDKITNKLLAMGIDEDTVEDKKIYIKNIKKNLYQTYDEINKKTKDAKNECKKIEEINNLSDFKNSKINIENLDIVKNSNQILELYPLIDIEEVKEAEKFKNIELNNIILHKIHILKYYSKDENKNKIYLGPLLDLHCLNMIKFIYKNSQNIDLFNELEKLYTSFTIINKSNIKSNIENDKLFFNNNNDNYYIINTLKLGEADYYTKNDYLMVLAPKLNKETTSGSIENRIYKIHTYKINNLPLERLIGLAFYEYWSIYKTDSSSLKKHNEIIDIILELLNQETITNQEIITEFKKESPGVNDITIITNFISEPNQDPLNEEINNPLIYILLALVVKQENKELKDKNKIIEKVKIVKNILELLIKKNKNIKDKIKDKILRTN